MNYFRILIITLPLIFFNGCEDEKDDEPSYLNLKSFSFKMDSDGELIWVGWGADGNGVPFGHLQIGAYDWIHLYEDEGYVERYVDDPNMVDPLYRMELEGLEYSYELMD